MRRFTAFVALVAAASFVPSSAWAESGLPPTPRLRSSIAQVRFADDIHAPSLAAPQAASANRRAQKTKAAIGLGFFGMLTGSWLGAKLYTCHCDDAGFTGGVVGASVGAVAGAIVGWHLGQ